MMAYIYLHTYYVCMYVFNWSLQVAVYNLDIWILVKVLKKINYTRK